MPDFGRKTPLEGSLVRLVPVRREHAAALHPLLADPVVGRLTGAVHSSAPDGAAQLPYTAPALAEVYSRWATDRDRIAWVIEDVATGRIVGESVLLDLDEGNLSCGFRIWISGARDRGLGTEAVELTLHHAFADQGLHRVGLEVYAFNPRARHVYEKAGFVHEGTRRDALLFDGAWVDSHVMGMLTAEWAERHGGS